MLNPMDFLKPFFGKAKEKGLSIPDAEQERLSAEIANQLNYVPRIGFFGKTGVGKSSLCNALFGCDICAVSDVESCTRKPQEVLLPHGKTQGVTLIDIPGVGETHDRDEEYARLYQTLLPELDCIFWLLKADDRAYTTDELFYKNVVKPHLDQGKPLIFVINQADRIHPFHEWQEAKCQPGPTQQQHLKAKIQVVAQSFGYPEDRIIAVSANEKYQLTALVDLMIDVLPSEKRLPTLNTVAPENQSDATREKAQKSWLIYMGETVEKTMKTLFSPTELLKAGLDMANTFNEIFLRNTRAMTDLVFGPWGRRPSDGDK